MREFHCFAHKNITSNCGWKSQVVWHAGQRSRCFYEVQSLWIKWGLPEWWVFTPVPVGVKGSFAKWSSSGVSAPVKQRMVSVAVSRSSKGVEIWYKLQHSPFADPYLTLPYLSLPYRTVPHSFLWVGLVPSPKFLSFMSSLRVLWASTQV